MKNILKRLIFLLAGFSLIISCEEIFGIRYFNVENRTNKHVYTRYSFVYPDVSLKGIDYRPELKWDSYKIEPGQIENAPLSFFSYNKTVQLFIFDAEEVQKTPWDTIVKYNRYLKHYQFTESELEKMNWEIIYDGK